MVALLMLVTMAAPIVEAQQVSRKLARNRQPSRSQRVIVTTVMTLTDLSYALALLPSFAVVCIETLQANHQCHAELAESSALRRARDELARDLIEARAQLVQCSSALKEAQAQAARIPRTKSVRAL
jgi:hypothetical protein